MFYKSSCYIYLDARAVISHREDFRIIDTPESFRISRTSSNSGQNIFKSKCFTFVRAHSLVVSNMSLEIKDSRLESGC